jgi:hypothetical protein
VKTCATVGIWRGGIGGCRRVVMPRWLARVSVCKIRIRGQYIPPAKTAVETQAY